MSDDGRDDAGLAAACAALAAQLDALDAYEVRNGRACAGLHTTDLAAADPDRHPVARIAGKLTSRPPGNMAVLDALLDAHELIRRVEASMRLIVTGRPGRARGGSDANTRAALAAIERMGTAVPYDAARTAARLLARAALRIEGLRALDTAPPAWEKIRAGPDGLAPRCVRCSTFSLRVAPESGRIACLLPGCLDDRGMPPRGRLDVSRLTGDPVILWDDGLVQYAPGPEPGPGPEPEPATDPDLMRQQLP